jgi:4-amino-4-deoxy-L-arabinose transferase-like glycosyltransferase
MSFADRLRRIPTGGWVLIFAAAMLLPGLGSSGFWEPWELNIADRAREIGRAGHLFDPTMGGRYGGEPPLDLFLAALGMQIFGAHELGARIFGALFGIVAIFGVYYGGVGLFRRRAGLLGALALGTMPLFLLQGRQLTSDMPLVAGLALSMAGLGRYAWPPTGQRAWRDLAVGVLGLLVGLLSGGALLGVVLPCLALTAAIAAGWGLSTRAAESETAAHLTSPGTGADVPAGTTFGAALRSRQARGRLVLGLLAVGGLALLIVTLTSANVAGRYSLLLGGVPRTGAPSQLFEYLVKQVGFGIFPWSAVVVFALGRGLIRLGGSNESDGGRLAFGQIYLLIFASFALALSTVFVLMTGDARFPALAALALAIGSFLDEALEGERPEPVLGLLIATGTMVVARDFFLEPEELVSVHLVGAKVKWPPVLSVGYVFLAAGLVMGLGIYTGLASRGRALGRVAPRDLGQRVRPWQRHLERLVVEAGRWGVQVAVAAAVLFAAFLAYALVPMLSRHLSFKPVLESYARFAKADEEIGKYRVEGHGTGFYSKRTLIEIPSQDRLVAFLRQQKRTFCLVSADDLAGLDAAFKVAKVDYYVVDASSSRFLLLSNRLGDGNTDNNPLKRDVWMAPRPPEAVPVPGSDKPRYDWHGATPPWQWRIPMSTVFQDAIELVGADFPTSMRRPGKIPLTLYFRVNARPPGGFKIFVHFDALNEPRLIGDHAPLDGAFPTANWLPGEYIRDRYEVDVPLMTTPASTYTILMGFWPGGEGKRLRITAGNNDNGDRTRIGTIDIR